jgi:hypothetical protein
VPEVRTVLVCEFRSSGGTLLLPFRAVSDNEFSRLQLHHHGQKVLDLRWTAAGDFTTFKYEPGDWESLLMDLPPIPFE